MVTGKLGHKGRICSIKVLDDSHFCSIDINGKIVIKDKLNDEQKKITNFLSSLDSKIDLVSTQIENTKAFKKGLLQQMFV